MILPMTNCTDYCWHLFSNCWCLHCLVLVGLAVVFYPTYLAHERATGVTEAGVAASALVAGAKHVVGDSVQRQKARAPPALRC